MIPRSRTVTKRRPTHPGEVIQELILNDMNMTQSELAERLADLSNGKTKHSTMLKKLNEVIRGRRAMTAEMALLLGAATNIHPKIWLGLQTTLDLWEAQSQFENLPAFSYA